VRRCSERDGMTKQRVNDRTDKRSSYSQSLFGHDPSSVGLVGWLDLTVWMRPTSLSLCESKGDLVAVEKGEVGGRRQEVEPRRRGEARSVTGPSHFRIAPPSLIGCSFPCFPQGLQGSQGAEKQGRQDNDLA
jgi:hypothetical protein